MGVLQRDGSRCVATVDGANWQAYCDIGSPVWDDTEDPFFDMARLQTHDLVGTPPVVVWALVTSPGAGTYTLTDDAADKQQGAASTKLTGDAAYPGGTLEIEAGLTTNLEDAAYLRLWIKSSVATTFQIRLADTNSQTALHPTTETTTTSWAEYTFSIAGFLTANPLLDLANLSAVRYRVNRTAGGATTWRFDDLRAYP